MELASSLGTQKCKVLCYIQRSNPDKIYLSRTVCEQLGIVTSHRNSSLVQCSAVHACDNEACSCPPRTKPPPTPKEVPYDATDENREKIQSWLLDYYSSSTFNICEKQPLPMMSGPPLKLIVDSEAKPHAVHTPIPVPVHWQKALKASLDRDVRLNT